MSLQLKDRILSALSYLTMGMAGLIWLVFAYATKEKTSSYTMFNIYQSIFLSILLAVFSLLYDIAISTLQIIPFIGKLAYNFNLFFVKTPFYFGTSIFGCIFLFVLIYLCGFSLLGRKPKLPCITSIIHSNFGV